MPAADKRLPDCEGIETRVTTMITLATPAPTRGCPTVRVLRPVALVQQSTVTAESDKRLPDCEGIETDIRFCATESASPDKRLPDCEGIETDGKDGRHGHSRGPDKRLPDCEGIETSPPGRKAIAQFKPTRGCPTVRVLRLPALEQLPGLPDTDKRLPDCEGIETDCPQLVDQAASSDKRLPDCEGIETCHLPEARWG